MVTVGVGSKSSDCKVCKIRSLDVASDEQLVEFAPPSETQRLTPSSKPFWANYVKGVVQNFHSKNNWFNYYSTL